MPVDNILIFIPHFSMLIIYTDIEFLSSTVKAMRLSALSKSIRLYNLLYGSC